MLRSSVWMRLYRLNWIYFNLIVGKLCYIWIHYCYRIGINKQFPTPMCHQIPSLCESLNVTIIYCSKCSHRMWNNFNENILHNKILVWLIFPKFLNVVCLASFLFSFFFFFRCCCVQSVRFILTFSLVFLSLLVLLCFVINEHVWFNRVKFIVIWNTF